MADISKEALLNKAGLNQSEWEVVNYINEWTTRFLGGSQSIPATELAALIDAGETKKLSLL